MYVCHWLKKTDKLNQNNVEKWIKKTSFDDYNDFSVKSFNKGTTKKFAKLVFENMKNPKVNNWHHQTSKW